MTQVKQIKVDELAQMDASQLQDVQASIVNRMVEVNSRMSELSQSVQEYEGLKAELGALKSIKDGVKSMMENLPR